MKMVRVSPLSYMLFHLDFFKTWNWTIISSKLYYIIIYLNESLPNDNHKAEVPDVFPEPPATVHGSGTVVQAALKTEN